MATMPTTTMPKPAPQPAPAPAKAGAPAKPGDPANLGAEAPQEDQLHPQLTFFQQPWVQNILPFATSLTLHLVLIIVGLTLFKVVPHLAAAIREQIIIPDATMVADAPVGGVQNPGL